MKSFLLKISQCHLLTYLGRLAQLALWQVSHVYGKDSVEAIIKVSKSVSALCKLYSLSRSIFLSHCPTVGGRTGRALEREGREDETQQADEHTHHTYPEKKYTKRYFHSLMHIGEREIKAHFKNAHSPITAYNFPCALKEYCNTPLCFGCWNTQQHRLILI